LWTLARAPCAQRGVKLARELVGQRGGIGCALAGRRVVGRGRGALAFKLGQALAEFRYRVGVVGVDGARRRRVDVLRAPAERSRFVRVLDRTPRSPLDPLVVAFGSAVPERRIGKGLSLLRATLVSRGRARPLGSPRGGVGLVLEASKLGAKNA
jgi:hypothetical protein